MFLRGIKFRNVWMGAGLVGFGGEKYRHHDFMKWCPGYGGLENTTPVWKTTPVDGAKGNMPLDPQNNYRPKEFKPECIHVSLRSLWYGAMLNAVAFSAPTLETLFMLGTWDNITEPFMFSLSFTGTTPEARADEARRTVAIIKTHKYRLKAPFGIQTNWSCGNRDHHIDELVGEFEALTEIFAELDRPQIPKVNALFPIKAVKHMAGSRHVDALVCSNGIKWDDVPADVKMKCFGTLVSPLAKFKGGAFSGGDWLRIATLEAIRCYRREGIRIPIIGGGGLRKKVHALQFQLAGCQGVNISSGIYPLRFWRGESVIEYSNQIFAFE